MSTLVCVQSTEPLMLPVWKPADVSALLSDFLAVAATSSGRATKYNSREAQQAAELSSHDLCMEFDRELYLLLLLLPGMQDRARQIGIRKHLSKRYNSLNLEDRVTGMVVQELVSMLPPQRAFKIFESFRDSAEGLGKVNNARSRKLVLKTILGSSKLDFWAVKYKKKIRAILTHAWGKRSSSILLKVFAKDASIWNEQEQKLVRKLFGRYVTDFEKARDSVEFVFGCYIRRYRADTRSKRPLFHAYYDARENLAKGTRLPLEVLEGIRSNYHKDVPSSKVLELKKGSLTRNQRIQVQERAEKVGVQVDVDLNHYDMVKLYLYAYKRGMTEEIRNILNSKARKNAALALHNYDKIGIIVDASKSMEGDKTQELRPIATALAIRDTLHSAQNTSSEFVSAGKMREDGLIMPNGPTSLYRELLDLLRQPLDAIYVISDGYENAPQGLFGAVLEAARRIGVETPVYQINPVFAAETRSTRKLCEDVTVLSGNNPETMFGMANIQQLLQEDPYRGIEALFRSMTKKILANENIQ